MTLQDFLALLRGVKRSGDGSYTALCPAHDDRAASLSVREGDDGKILLKCFAGCHPGAITKAAGIGLVDLFPNGGGPAPAPSRSPRVTLAAFAEAKGLPVDFLTACGVVEDARGLQITYRLRDGSPAPRQRRRTALAAKDGSTWDGPRGTSPVAYGLWRLEDAREKGELLLVEGESDALTAWAHNVPCLGIPGADMAKVLAAEDLAGIDTVFVVKEPDRGGDTFVAGVDQRLRALGWSGAARMVRLPVKDLNDLHTKHGADFARRLDAAKRDSHPLAIEEPTAAGPTPDAPGRVATLTWAEMIATPLQPIAYHWPGWVGLATVTVLAGAGESLKSWLCLYLALMTAAGRGALTGDPVKAGPVLYLAAENSIEEEKRRCQLLRAGLDLPGELPITFVPAESLSLGSDEDYAAITRLVEDLRPVALFIDSAIALSGIPQENDNALVRAFMKSRILPFSRTHGVTVYLVQHSPKPSMQPGARFTDEHVARGAGDWRNAADVVLYLRRDPTLGPQAVVLRHAKQRIGPRHAPVWFTLEDVEPQRSARLVYGGTYSDEAGQGASAGLARAVGAAVDILKATPGGIYRADLQQQLTAAGIARATWRRALDVLRAKIPWPYGSLRGQKHAVVTEDRHGRQVFLTFIPSAWPSEEDSDDA